ncbi:MAG: hypothetical protein U9R05_08405, partial [Chloroflexota bacterium]|nr:hypothetical protein [Chloroflexota bacterium]
MPIAPYPAQIDHKSGGDYHHRDAGLPANRELAAEGMLDASDGGFNSGTEIRWASPLGRSADLAELRDFDLTTRDPQHAHRTAFERL